MKYKVIKNIDQYNEYCNRYEKLIINGKDSDRDEIELLELLMEDYDNKLLKKHFKEYNPIELLKSLLHTNEMTQTQLAKSINVSRQLISDVMSYRRNISKDLVLKLANLFSMSPEAFAREYDLKTNRKKLEEFKRVIEMGQISKETTFIEFKNLPSPKKVSSTMIVEETKQSYSRSKITNKSKPSKLDAKLAQYSKAISKSSKDTVNPDLLRSAAKAAGPSIYLKDASYVSLKDSKEIERIKVNFLAKRLGVKGKKADEAIEAVKGMYTARLKHRPVVYYLLAQYLKKGKKL